MQIHLHTIGFRNGRAGVIRCRSRRAIVASAVLLCIFGYSKGNTVLIDDFDDGNDDGWTHVDFSTNAPWGPAIFDASSGAYDLKTTGELPRGLVSGIVNSIWNESSAPSYSDGFLRAMVRPGNGGSIGGLLMRYEGDSSYVFGVDASQGNFYFDSYQNGRLLQNTTFGVPNHPVLPGDDWIVESGSVGDRITMKVWPADQPEPIEPQLQLTDSHLSQGAFGVTAGVNFQSQGPWQTSATFDDITFTSAGSSSGDFDANGILDAADVDSLAESIRGTRDAQFDLNSDSIVNNDDLRIWVEDLKGTHLGDANLDGVVSFLDFLTVSSNSGEPGAWSDGDFDASGDVQFSDFVILSNNFGNSSGNVAPVPEPSAILLLMPALLPIMTHQRRFKTSPRFSQSVSRGVVSCRMT